MSNLSIQISQIDGKVPITVMNITGEIDVKNHWELDAKTEKLINDGVRHILINLTDSDDMCCAGFRSIYRAFVGLRRGNEGKSPLKLLRPSDRAKHMMKTMGFDVLIPSFNDYDEAVRSFN